MSNTFKPNPSQQKAIESRNKNVIVSASAGSGKTALLIERSRRIIDDRISIDQIVAMTFTEKAAAEMKNRTKSFLAYKIIQMMRFSQTIRTTPSAQIQPSTLSLKIIKEFAFITINSNQPKTYLRPRYLLHSE